MKYHSKIQNQCFRWRKASNVIMKFLTGDAFLLEAGRRWQKFVAAAAGSACPKNEIEKNPRYKRARWWCRCVLCVLSLSLCVRALYAQTAQRIPVCRELFARMAARWQNKHSKKNRTLKSPIATKCFPKFFCKSSRNWNEHTR